MPEAFTDGAKVLGANLKILKPGFYEITKGDNRIVKARGVGRPPDILQPTFHTKRRFGLSLAVKGQLKRLNVIEDMEIDNHLDTASKREWPSDLSLADIRAGGSQVSKPLRI